MDNISGFSRTHYCGDVRDGDIGKTVSVCGWVARRRDLGQLLFIDLRDRTGLIQLAFDEGTAREIFDKAAQLRSEFVVAATGTLRERSSKNPDLPTGCVELEVTQLRILARSETPPFEIASAREVNDALRLKYRYLDLRREEMQRTLALRHRVSKLARDYFDENGFLEIETPMLTKSTPEGARDYLVPSRIHPGAFYALPQSPQQYKQLLMLSGFDRYFQIVRCFRDEDLRADRQPEFTQIDLEMSFVDVDDVIAVNEGFLARLFRETLGVELELPISRMTYSEAMSRYGSDKPDLRFGLELCDVTDILPETRAIKSPRAPRKTLDKLSDFSKGIGGRGIVLHTAKFVTDEQRAAIESRLGGVSEEECIMLLRDAPPQLGLVRVELAKTLGIIPKDVYKPVWITEFPMFEFSEEENRYVAMHHPFTAPMDEDAHLLETDKLRCRAKAYDIVINGCEAGGGSIRINTPELQEAMFRALGLSNEDVALRFNHLITAFKYGAPPHGGLAYGLDRLVMLLAGAESIRDVIAFPKVQNASELMTQCPDEVEEKQLAELGIKTIAGDKNDFSRQ
ncbi:MAG: aspartate--tRNA ligase [Oscillospiraceae bacterium]|jgi:aspartyl-tRNA synthetase|nr:aspartate--tRNA ligase [Oscillospiraceae bacterium]